MSEHLRIFDTTLRDGEQSPGCSMTQVSTSGVMTILVSAKANAGANVSAVNRADAVRILRMMSSRNCTPFLPQQSVFGEFVPFCGRRGLITDMCCFERDELHNGQFWARNQGNRTHRKRQLHPIVEAEAPLIFPRALIFYERLWHFASVAKGCVNCDWLPKITDMIA